MSLDKSLSLEAYLNISSINNSAVIQGRDGSLGAVFKLRGLELSFRSEEELAQLEDYWRRIVQLRKNECLQFVFQKNTDFSEFYGKKLEQIRLAHTHAARKIAEEHLIGWMSDFEGSLSKRFRSSLSLTYWLRPKNQGVSKQEFLSRLQRLETTLKFSGVKLQRLNSQEIHRLICRSTRGAETANCGIKLPEVEIYPKKLIVDEQRISALYLKDLPEKYTEMGLIQALAKLPYSFDMALTLEGDPSETLKKRLRRKKQFLLSMLLGREARDPEKENQLEEIDDVLSRMNKQSDFLLRMNFCIVFRSPVDDDILQEKILSEILSAESEMGLLEFEPATFSCFDAYLMTIPASKFQQLEPKTILSSNAVHFLPLMAENSGDDDKPAITFPTRFGFQYSIDPTSRRFANYNWLVAGTSGSGKSFFVNSLISQSSVLNPQVFIVDIGGSYKHLTKFLGGSYIQVTPGSGFHLSPLFYPKSEDPHEERRRRAQIQMLFVELCRHEEGSLPVEERRKLIDEVNRILDQEEPCAHPIAEVKNALRTKGDEQSRRLAFLLERWAYPSFFGDFLDHPHMPHLDNDVICFDIKGSEEFPDLARIVQLIISASLWARVRQAKQRFSWVVLDEVAFSLLRWQPEFVEELVSTIRKHFGGVIMVVQDLEKITESVAGATILQNTQLKALLQQRGHPEKLRRPLGLDGIDIHALNSLRRVKGSFSEIFLMSDHERMILRHRANLFEYYLSTTDSREVHYLESALSGYDGSFRERYEKFVEQEMGRVA